MGYRCLFEGFWDADFDDVIFFSLLLLLLAVCVHHQEKNRKPYLRFGQHTHTNIIHCILFFFFFFFLRLFIYLQQP